MSEPPPARQETVQPKMVRPLAEEPPSDNFDRRESPRSSVSRNTAKIAAPPEGSPPTPSAPNRAAGAPAGSALEVQLGADKSMVESSVWAVKAAEAKKAGNRRAEASYLRRAVAVTEDKTALLRLLAELCDADRSLRSAPDVRTSCGRIVKEFPVSQEAKTAEAALREFSP
jgi:hypothetical protein